MEKKTLTFFLIVIIFYYKAELDRFQDTARMLKDYYKCMTNPVPEDVLREYPRLPLIDVKFILNRFYNLI